MATKERRHSDWMKTYWRPMSAWLYLVICSFDFMLGPICLGIYSVYTKTPMNQWSPLTLQGGGLFHLSFGAIIGITAFGRTQEKIETNKQLSSLPISTHTDDEEK